MIINYALNIYSRDYSMHFDSSKSNIIWCLCFFLDNAIILFNKLSAIVCILIFISFKTTILYCYFCSWKSFRLGLSNENFPFLLFFVSFCISKLPSGIIFLLAERYFLIFFFSVSLLEKNSLIFYLSEFYHVTITEEYFFVGMES